MSDSTSRDADEYEDIDGMAHLQIWTPLAASNSTTNKPMSTSLDDLVEDFKRANEDLAISEKFRKLYEAKTRFHLEKQLVEYQRKKREEKRKKLAIIEKKRIGIQKLRLKEQTIKTEEKSKD